MKKSFLMLATVTTVGLGTFFGGASLQTEAESVSNLQGQQSKIQSQRSDLQSNINESNNKITDLQNQQANVKDEMKRLDFAISDTSNQINEKNKKVDSTKAEIAKLQQDIVVIKERIEKRNILLKERVRSYQENGTVINYLDVLMGAKSFSDFIDRASAVATFMEADQAIIKEHEADKQELETKESLVEKDLSNLQSMVAELKKMNQQLNTQMDQKNQLLAGLEQQEDEAHAEMIDMQEQEQILAAQEAAIQKAIKLAQDQAAAAAAAAAANNSSGGGSSSSSSAPPVSGGSFTRPAAGAITSGFGSRDGAFHYGVDIAKSGSVPIVAAADGVVYVSHYSSSYGNVVYIMHNINGQMYTTVYAHMSTRMVSEGATVKKGQQIGIMGNTGDSRGQHLHFELYRGKWAYHSAINPVGIVPL
ncbi:murein hydrolase activator EnvC family protein [Bacillus sp. JJ1764]|uniref:murein hydrolase activator EnvC family protein n=1 Tax=Bacillus sp. JJ1764 TaxID=3122964 RepID=UPI003000E945